MRKAEEERILLVPGSIALPPQQSHKIWPCEESSPVSWVPSPACVIVQDQPLHQQTACINCCVAVARINCLHASAAALEPCCSPKPRCSPEPCCPEPCCLLRTWNPAADPAQNLLEAGDFPHSLFPLFTKQIFGCVFLEIAVYRLTKSCPRSPDYARPLNCPLHRLRCRNRLTQIAPLNRPLSCPRRRNCFDTRKSLSGIFSTPTITCASVPFPHFHLLLPRSHFLTSGRISSLNTSSRF